MWIHEGARDVTREQQLWTNDMAECVGRVGEIVVVDSEGCVDASVLVRVLFEDKARTEEFWWPIDALRLVPSLIGSNAWVGLERIGDVARELHVSVVAFFCFCGLCCAGWRFVEGT